MHEIITFFEELSSAQKFLWIVFCMGIFWILESAFLLAKFTYEKWKHARVNLVLLTTTIIINVLFGVLTAGIFVWAGSNNFGLLYIVDLPLWIEVLLGVMILDMIAQYLVHYLLHRV